jgi:hypothetical protein
VTGPRTATSQRAAADDPFSRRLLLVGAPRFGTTWTAPALAMTLGTSYLHEPDNPNRDPLAFRSRRGAGQWPILEPGEAAPAYERLWDHAFNPTRPPTATPRAQLRRVRVETARRLLHTKDRDARNRALSPGGGRVTLRLRMADALATPRDLEGSGGCLLIKSVHSPLAVDWLADRYDFDVAVMLRQPLNVIAGWMARGWGRRPPEAFNLETHPRIRELYVDRYGVPLPESGASELQLTAWRVGLLTFALQAAARRHPRWRVIVHERLCEDPPERFRELCAELGLVWVEAVDRYLNEHDEPGSGWKTSRVASTLPGRWRSELSPEQVREIRDVLSGFALDLAPFGFSDWSDVTR